MWRARLFELSDAEMTYFDSKGAPQTLNLAALTALEHGDTPWPVFCIRKDAEFRVASAGTEWTIRCPTEEIARDWEQARGPCTHGAPSVKALVYRHCRYACI